MGLKAPFKLPWAPAAGDFAPLWTALDSAGVLWNIDGAPGRAQLLCFVSPSENAAPFFAALAKLLPQIEALGCVARAFATEPAQAISGLPFPILIDPGGTLSRAFLLGADQRTAGKLAPGAVLVDAEGRVIFSAPLELSEDGAAALAKLVAAHAPFNALRSPHAPLLHVPALFSRAFCGELIAAFNAGAPVDGTTMVMRDGKFEHVVRPAHKRRSDLRLEGKWRARVWEQLKWRLLPAVRKSFRFEITRLEYLQLGRYRAEDGGHFNAHRDDDNQGCSHRRFALTVNLNDGYDGGELCFHESGESVKPGVGGAVLFSCSLLHEAKLVTRGERFVLVGMFWSEFEEPQYQRNLTLGAGAKAVDPRAQRKKLLDESARMLREVAGDVQALSGNLDSKSAQETEAQLRLARLHGDLTRLRNDLRALRNPYIDAQLNALGISNSASGLKLHLGCGSIRLKDWINIDAGRGDLSMDLRWKLPFADASVEYVFASHVLEHLYRHGELGGLLAEIHRVLKPGGVLRAIVPDIEKCLRAYASNDAQFFAERKKTWAWAASCKTPLDHFLTYAGANQALEGFEGHKYGYDFQTLSLALNEAGFSSIAKSDFMQSAHAALRIDDQSHNAIANVDGAYYSLFVEAQKRSV